MPKKVFTSGTEGQMGEGEVWRTFVWYTTYFSIVSILG